MTGRVHLRFYGELNDFLLPAQRSISFEHDCGQPRSIKDMIEALGVPHTEIDLILVNGDAVDFNYQVKNEARISVYPEFTALDPGSYQRLRPAPLHETRFILDTHLGRLAAYLRLLGFDTLYRNDYDDPALADVSAREQRILLTRDRQLLMRKQVTYGYFVRSTQPRAQLLEVLNRFDLRRKQRPYSRCLHCNGEIRPVAKEAIEQHLPPRTRAWCQKFWQCASCQKIYWKGAHYHRIQQLIDTINAHTASA